MTLDLSDPNTILAVEHTLNEFYYKTPLLPLLESIAAEIEAKAKEDCINGVGSVDRCAGVRDGARYLLLQLAQIKVAAEGIRSAQADTEDTASTFIEREPSPFGGGGLVEY